MLIIFGIIVILCSIILGIIVLIQNPTGGGLAGTFGGIGNQLMGVKQTTNILEKGTWLFAGILGALCLLSPAFIPKNTSASSQDDKYFNSAPATTPSTNTQNTVPLNNGNGATPSGTNK